MSNRTARYRIAAYLGAVLLGAGFTCGCAAPADRIVAANLQAHVNVLAAPEMRGRAFASPEEEQAAAYIVKQLRLAGLKPPPGWDDPIQTFSLKRGQLARNVVFAVRGSDPALDSEWIVLGAHYDHLGVRDGVIYPGADDNASGVAGMIEVAKTLQAHRRDLGRSVLICFFTGEERGFLGSRHFGRYMPVPRESVVAMLNADMISREPTFGIHVVGTQTSKPLARIVEQANQDVGLGLYYDHPEWIHESDQIVFYRKHIPVLYFGVENHIDYHQPTDTPDRIDAHLLEAVSRLIYNTTVLLSNAPRPAWSAEEDLPSASKTVGPGPRWSASGFSAAAHIN